ncbi:DEAD/DEAH box helicase [Barrientosiimonas marina]|uniref:DUF3427 domain-containing protein n=1 Tax=Lentibacillus kimchii TaxID=1542911 RepID=A0ABW2UVV0_9BACI
MEDFLSNLENSLYKGFIDQNIGTAGRYKPELLVNDTRANEHVLTSLVDELDTCQSFIFSVAFITESGLATLKSQLLDLKRRGVRGRILTSTFLHFNQPKVFKELMKITNVEVRLTSLEGFHSKGYIFDHDQHVSLIVGSSNLTAQALKVNYEWNIKVTSHQNGEVIAHFKDQFERAWEQASLLTDDWIASYEAMYEPETYETANKVMELPKTYGANPVREAVTIQPNKMQEEALKHIQAVRDEGQDRGLVISATGTGKTYLAAFDVRRVAPIRMLFIVHRAQILEQAMADFQRVMGGMDKDFGILSGSSKQTNVTYLFATIQTISKQDVLNQFSTQEFDYILVDEVHKAGASSYLKVLDYFNPDFLLGMTATPERTDDFNIFELFNYNIAYEIRLQEALEEDMLSPFHYFGVTDFEYNGQLIDDTTMLSNLVTDERVEHIMDKVHYYGHSGDRVKGIMFCSRQQEAIELSQALNERGYRTAALTGKSSQEERLHQVDRLENGALDYILTVDIFNEGIDIPSINQIVMLRQTASSIVFIQQLGRGLRKHGSKDFATIIDFIGNYKNNYLIPIALSGDGSQNKDNIRRRTTESSYIKGVSTVNFEEIAKKQIFDSINASKLTSMRTIQDAFAALKNRIGRTPYLYDFIINHSIDPVVIANKFKNYYTFLIKMREDVQGFSSYETSILTMFTLEFLNGKRQHELILLDQLLRKQTITYNTYLDALRDSGCLVDQDTLKSVHRIFNLSFFTQKDKDKYGTMPIVQWDADNNYSFNHKIQKSLEVNTQFKHLVEDVIQTGLKRSERYGTGNGLTRYEKYTRKDVCRLLNWDKDEKGTMFGYKVKHQTCPIFVTYHKDSQVDDSVAYGDELISPEIMKWESRNNVNISSSEVQKIIYAKEQGIDIHLFVKKSDDEDGGDFYYLGRPLPDKRSVEQTTMPNTKGQMVPVVHMNMVLDQPIEQRMYHYIVDA